MLKFLKHQKCKYWIKMNSFHSKDDAKSLKVWGESSLNWVLELCPTSYIGLICQPQVIPNQRTPHPPVNLRNCALWLLLWEMHALVHYFCALAHPCQVITCKGNYWLLSQTFPEVIGRVTSTQHVTSTMSFLPHQEAESNFAAIYLGVLKPKTIMVQGSCINTLVHGEKTKTFTTVIPVYSTFYATSVHKTKKKILSILQFHVQQCMLGRKRMRNEWRKQFAPLNKINMAMLPEDAMWNPVEFKFL